MTLRFCSLCLLVAATACAPPRADSTGPPPPPGPTTAPPSEDRVATLAEGAYTAAQAEQGGEVFKGICSECHTTREFRGTDFFFNWEGSSLGRLVELVSETMPENDPGGLTMDQYLAVAAYILQLNGYPTGARPLPADPDYLRTLTLERSGGGARHVSFGGRSTDG